VFPLTISKKISISVLIVLVLSVSGMGWLTVRSLQSGFNAYLRETQEIELQKISRAMSVYYRDNGTFQSLQHNPGEVKRLIDRALSRLPTDGLPPDMPPPEREGFERERSNPDPRADGRREREPPRERPRRPPPERLSGDDARQRPARDAFDIGPRISLVDAQGTSIFGPLRAHQASLKAEVEVEGKKVGMVLAPLPQFALEKVSSDFVRSQIRQIILIVSCFIGLAILVSIWLGRHLVKPIAGLRKLTQQIAGGQFQARAEVLNQDEIGGLAQHINSMAKSLEDNERKRKNIMADISHELRTPLTVMRAEVEAIIDGVRPLNLDALRSIEAEIHHLNKLVDDLHQLALADAGDLRFQFGRVDVAALLSQIGERFQARMQQAKLQLQVDVPDLPVMLHADAGRLTQIIENLLENSLRYTDPDGRVLIRLTRDAGLARISLEDSAPGLNDDQHQRMFERLYREDKARSRAKGGSGLGLSICRTLVQAHRGEIQTSASALGGVKITILFPLLDMKRGE
jgi:two-component system sensor histidine kinase BaeS